MRVLVCGGRNYNNRDFVFATLDRVHSKHGITALIEGGQTGADSAGRMWALGQGGVEHAPFPADWKAHGRAAGPIRNKQMLDEGKPDVVIAFPGGAGTASMMLLAQKAGVKVWQPRFVEEPTP